MNFDPAPFAITFSFFSYLGTLYIVAKFLTREKK
jgi:hypothetical protein